MSKIFEDAFMEVQTDMIRLCCELTGNAVDGIYVYCSSEDGMREFNAFFTRQGKVVRLHELGVDRQLQSQFLGIGLSDLRKIKNICKEYNQPMPTEMKLMYDVKNRKFGASYQYEPVQTMDIGFMDLMNAWAEEVAQGLTAEQQGQPITAPPVQEQTLPEAPKAEVKEEKTPKKRGFKFPFFGKR